MIYCISNSLFSYPLIETFNNCRHKSVEECQKNSTLALPYSSNVLDLIVVAQNPKAKSILNDRIIGLASEKKQIKGCVRYFPRQSNIRRLPLVHHIDAEENHYEKGQTENVIFCLVYSTWNFSDCRSSAVPMQGVIVFILYTRLPTHL